MEMDDPSDRVIKFYAAGTASETEFEVILLVFEITVIELSNVLATREISPYSPRLSGDKSSFCKCLRIPEMICRDL